MVGLGKKQFNRLIAMTAREKAHNLLKKYFYIYEKYPANRQAALMTVMEIQIILSSNDKFKEEYGYWVDVQNEILSIDREVTRGDSQEARADRFNEDL